MVCYQIRRYQDEDYEVVREVYATGFVEHLDAVCYQALRQTWIQLLLLSLLCSVQALSGSLTAMLAAAVMALLAGREVVRYLLSQGIQLGLHEDLLDINTSYMREGQVSCFWVAESQGHVVGTVAILPAASHPGIWELKRISVRKEFRGHGIAKALCQTALEFVGSRGVVDIVLFTSMLQTDAHKLYHSIGFRKVEEFVWPSLPAKMIGFMVFRYVYRVPQRQPVEPDTNTSLE
ncbi:N-acetyltransferase 8 isoform X1 [Esox lucius]|uniref:N-acetyltransferase domain-containing protein n=1 Tax=Esox lucius TaxID=8010 RepID=A0A3P8ZC26_ESOLU|nr:N-acetyltransferase 8 isoform X1 [Esox lucius]